MALPKILVHVAGKIRQMLPVQASAGAADAEKIPALNASGVLAPSLLNAAETGNSKVVMTNSSGQLDPSVMPTGIGADTVSLPASEALASGDMVNVWNDAGTAKVRKADATAEGKEAHGFVLAAVASLATASVYLEGRVTGLTSKTPGARQYLSTTPGALTETPPAANGNVVQYIGQAMGATSVNFEPDDAITVVA